VIVDGASPPPPAPRPEFISTIPSAEAYPDEMVIVLPFPPSLDFDRDLSLLLFLLLFLPAPALRLVGFDEDDARVSDAVAAAAEVADVEVRC